jgi:hypothetical protein
VVSANLSQEEHQLFRMVETSECTLGDLQRDLQVVEVELVKLTERNHEYDLLSNICRSLEELKNIGSEQLFWDTASTEFDPDETIQAVCRKIDVFGDTISHVKERRQSIIEKIGGQNETLQLLHYDLLEAMEEEEYRQNEWLVERDVGGLPARNQIMPWARGCEEDNRFRRSLLASLVASVALGLLISIIDLPIQDISSIIKVPERVAKLVREERKLPPQAETVDEPAIPEEQPPELADVEPPAVSPEVVEQPAVAQAAIETTREQVKSKGILAFRESFANRANLKPTTQLGSNARVNSAGEKVVGRPERSMVTTSAPGSSGGINLSAISRDVGGGGQGIGGVEIGQVASSIGGAEGVDRPLSGGASAGRTDEEIQIVFDRYKAALYRLYNRELRKNPTLRGQLTLRLTIEPDGSVSMCQLQSSSLDSPALAQRVVDRVRAFDFGAKEGIVAMTIIYPIDFLPAG